MIAYAKDWPHGLRCMACDAPLNEGDAYAERLESMMFDAPVVSIVCAPTCRTLN